MPPQHWPAALSVVLLRHEIGGRHKYYNVNREDLTTNDC